MQGFEQQFGIKPNFNPDRKIYGVVQGEFILDGETIFLQIFSGDRFELDRVAITSNAFNDKDGVLRYPKPSIYAEGGNLTQQGDLVIVAFGNGDIYNPMVLGSIIPFYKNDFFHDFDLDNYLKKKARYETDNYVIEFQDDGDGEIQLDVTAQAEGTGNITVNLEGVGDNGNVTVNVNGNATLKADKKVIIDSPLIEVGKDSTEKLVKGNLWAALYKAHTHPTPNGPSGAPVNAAQADNCLSEQNTTL